MLKKRPDGFHDLNTVMYPILGASDIVELRRCDRDGFISSGIAVDCPTDKNLCMRALRLMQDRYGIGGVKILLHKQIPFGAGLGGGSANAVAVLKLVNDEFELGLGKDTLVDLAAQLGSDTPFFVEQRPMLATSRGEILEPVAVDLSNYYIYIVKPDIAISTAMAYTSVKPKMCDVDLKEVIKRPVEQWRDLIVNDFEESLFEKFEQLKQIKQDFYDSGALYASMSGSGSAVYGIFDAQVKRQFDDLWYVEKPLNSH